MSEYEIPVSGGVNGLNVPLHGHISVYNKEFPVIPNPEGEPTGYVTSLGFQPEILQIKDPEVHEWARAEERPTYTKADVGLGNVDNTSDADKPISNDTQAALNLKADAASVYTQTETDNLLVGKVDKIPGKGLSTEDYSSQEKLKLSYIESGAERNVQSSWTETDNHSDAYIINKPTKLSNFTNDMGFIDNTVNNLVNYYLKSETYTKAEVNAIVEAVQTMHFEIVETLPTTDIQTNVIYLVPKNPAQTDNIYDEYINTNGTSEGWEKIGDTEIDLSNYYTKTQTDNLLSGKVDKVAGYGLSKNDYTDADKAIVDSVTAALAGKVDKVEGYGLSENDYSDTDKAKVGEIDNKLDKTETAVNSNGLVIATPVTDTAPYIYRQTPVKESFKALMHKIVGASVVWNQLVQNGNFASTDNWTDIGSVSKSASNNILSITASRTYDGVMQNVSVVPNHKHILFWEVKSPDLNAQLRSANAGITISPTVADTWQKFFTLVNANISTLDIRFRDKASTPSQTQNFRNAFLVDLSAMFGTTIADYVYTLETAEAGSGIAWLQSYGFFTEDYYAYKQNKLESGCVSAHKTYDGETLLTNTELSPITLRGLFKLSTNKLTVDGDEYNADGTVTRKYGESDLGNDLEWSFYNQSSYPTFYRADIPDKADGKVEMLLTANYTYTTTWATARDNSGYYFLDNAEGRTKRIYINDSNYATVQAFTNALKGQKVIYPLATPTTEQTTPFTETEIVGSTEEFIDYEVAQSNRDVAIPVGTETDYYQEMKLPSLPTTSGNHNLQYNPASGFSWS